jgi:hypothetical protein
MPSTDTKPELTAQASMAQPVSQPAVYANGLRQFTCVSLGEKKNFDNIKMHSMYVKMI